MCQQPDSNFVQDLEFAAEIRADVRKLFDQALDEHAEALAELEDR